MIFPDVQSTSVLPHTIQKIKANYRELPCEVVSCTEAADIKGIPLRNELKSLILETSKGLHLLHICGDKFADLRQVKKTLSVDQAYLASVGTLASLGVKPGTVTPFAENLWVLPQLISKEVFALTFVSTNNGTRTQYIVFSPTVLLENEHTVIGYFEKG